MKIRILAQHRLGEGLDQRTGGMAKGEIAGCYASRRRNLVLAVERRQKCAAEVFRIRRQIIQVRGSGQAGRRDVEKAIQVHGHGAVEDAAQKVRLNLSGISARSSALDQPVERVAVSERVVS